MKWLAGARSYERGAGYVQERRVEKPVERDGRFRAIVRGTVPYVVELWAADDQPRWSCTCPAAEDGSFCKHCVAVALSVLGDHKDSGTTLTSTLADGRTSRTEQASTGNDALSLDVWQRRIDRAFFSPRGFVRYFEAEDWADGIHVMIDSLESLCDAGHPDAVVGLVEHAIRRADESAGYIDHSDGHLLCVLERLADLHLEACSEGTAEPVELAARLVELELGSGLDVFQRAAADYAEVLGPTGIAEYRRLLEPRWRSVKPSAEWSDGSYEVRQAMVGWALATGDPDALIEVHSRGKLAPHDVLEIAIALKNAGRVDEAISWAKRSLAENRSHPTMTDTLREFLSRLLGERGEHAVVVDLFWQAFAAAPSVDRYRQLLDKAPSHDWLERCTGELRTSLARQPRPAADWPPSANSSAPALWQPPVSRGATALVEVLLFEGQADAAWDAAAEFGCDPTLRLTLARVREKTHPLDAIAVYRADALAIIGRKRSNNYHSAVDLMERIRRLADTADEPERFTSFLQQIRTEHKLKRRLMAEIDERGWPTST